MGGGLFPLDLLVDSPSTDSNQAVQQHFVKLLDHYQREYAQDGIFNNLVIIQECSFYGFTPVSEFNPLQRAHGFTNGFRLLFRSTLLFVR